MNNADREPGAVVAYRLRQLDGRFWFGWPTEATHEMYADTLEPVVLATDYAAMRARAEAAEKDAARYRWLRDNCFQTRHDDRPLPYVVIKAYLREDERGYIDQMIPGKISGVGVPSLDTVVDTAIAEQERGG